MPKLIPLKEFHWDEVSHEDLVVDGRLDIYPWVDKSDFFVLRTTSKKTEIQARGWVGIIPLNDNVTLDVTPRVDVVGNLSRFMEVSGESPTYLTQAIRGYARAGTLYPSLVTLYTEALHRAVNEVVSQGLLKEYRRRESVSSMPHGRIMVGPSIQRSIARGRSHELTISWFQRSVDNAANRCLLYATHRLSAYARTYGHSIGESDRRKVARQLNQCTQLLNGVKLDSNRGFLDDPIVQGLTTLPALRGYYRPALDLALTIVGGNALSMDQPGESVRLPSLLISMGGVFEAYLRKVLYRAGQVRGWPVDVLDGNRKPGAKNLLDEGSAITIEANPDIVLAAGPRTATTYPAILEVKYKPAKSRPKRGDLDQTLAYGASYRAKHVVVLQPRHPSGVPAGMHRIGSLAGMGVWMYVFDMGASDIVKEESNMADEIAKLFLPALR